MPLHGMRIALLLLVLLASPAAAYRFDPSAGVSKYESSDCGALLATNTDVPLWSRLSWGLGFGSDSYAEDGTTVLSLQASAALWVRERQCTPSSGGWFFTHRPWLRWSIALAGDAMWRLEDDGDVAARSMRPEPAAVPILRPALRFARARVNTPLIGSVWTPDSEWFATIGPTYEHAWQGVGASAGYRAGVIAVELRVNARGEHGTEGFLMFHLTDLHGIAPLGRTRR